MAYDIKIIRTWVEHPKGTRKNGKKKKPVFRVLYFNELSQKQVKMSKTIEKNTPQARNNARKSIIQKIRKKYERFESQSLSIGELAQKYYDYMNGSKSGFHYQTRYQYTQHVKNFIASLDPTILADNIKITFFNEYFDQLSAKHSYSYVNARRSAITSLYRFGIDYGYAHSNPLSGYKLRRKQKPKLVDPEDKYFKPSELKLIFEYLDKIGRYDYLDLFEFMYLTGMRLGETTALFPSNIHFKYGKYYASIVGTQISKHSSANARVKNKALNKDNLKPVIEKQNMTKTYKGTRMVELDSDAVAIYKRHKDNTSYLFTIGDGVKNTQKMPSYTIGHPFQNAAVNQFLKKIAARTGLKKNSKFLTSHVFRHTYISRMASYGVKFDMDFLSSIGHKDINTTRDVYTHVNSINHKKLEQGYKSIDNWIRNQKR